MLKNAGEKIPLYKQAEQYLTRAIAQGRWDDGSALPNEWDLAAEMGVSQGTMRKALTHLVEQGLLDRQQGVGTFVSKRNPEWGILPLCERHGRRRDVWPKQEILDIKSVHAPSAIKQLLQLPHGQRVWQVQSLWRNGHQTVACDEAWLPEALFPELNRLQLEKRMDIYTLLTRVYGKTPDARQTLLHTTQLDSETATRLKVPTFSPALRYERQSASGGLVVEWRCRHMVLEQTALLLPVA